MSDAGDPLLSVRNLKTTFETADGPFVAVSDVSFNVYRGETVCLVGESGSGKTVACESLTRLTTGRVEGTVEFDGIDLTMRSDYALRRLRGGRIAHVFQNPQDALDPVYTVREQLVEAICLHTDASKREASERAVSLLDQVGIPDPAARADEYPHSFSGGMRQRVVIAMALAADPALLIADEPTTALDVTIQAQILELLRKLQRQRELAVLFVTHDLGVVAELADRVVVMYAGSVMERGDVFDSFERPAHPYTRALLASLPGWITDREVPENSTAAPAETGCRFATRCPYAVPDCSDGGQPELVELGTGQSVSCLHYDEADPPVVSLTSEVGR